MSETTGEQTSVASYLRALAEISSSLTVQSVQGAIASSLRAICQTMRWPLAELWTWEGTRLQLRYFWHDGSLRDFVESSKRLNLTPNEGLHRQVFVEQAPIFVANLAEERSKRAQLAARYGLQCSLAMPIRTKVPPAYGLVLIDRVDRDDVEIITPTVQVVCDVLAFFISWARTEEINRAIQSAPSDEELPTFWPEGLSIEPEAQVIHGPHGALRLTGMEWMVLKELYDNRGRVTNHQELLLELWGVVDRNSRSSLYEIVSRLRRHLRDVGIDENIIRSVARQGYLLEEH